MDEAMVAGANEEPAKKNTYTVWAPRADEIQLVLNGETHPMSRAGEWFTSEIEPRLGDRYGFKIDGGDPIADPCSRRQPDGIHGLSEHWEIDRPRSPSTPISPAKCSTNCMLAHSPLREPWIRQSTS